LDATPDRIAILSEQLAVIGERPGRTPPKGRCTTPVAHYTNKPRTS
jgi:hypothetical protein